MGRTRNIDEIDRLLEELALPKELRDWFLGYNDDASSKNEDQTTTTDTPDQLTSIQEVGDGPDCEDS